MTTKEKCQAFKYASVGGQLIRNIFTGKGVVYCIAHVDINVNKVVLLLFNLEFWERTGLTHKKAYYSDISHSCKYIMFMCCAYITLNDDEQEKHLHVSNVHEFADCIFITSFFLFH